MAAATETSAPMDNLSAGKPSSPLDADAKEAGSSTRAMFGAGEGQQVRPECNRCEQIYRSLSVEEQEDWPPVNNLDKPCHGWPAVANLMYKNPGFESFQSFRDLHVKSLLYYQGELDQFRIELHQLEWLDHTEGSFKFHEKLSRNMGFLFRSRRDGASDSEGSNQILMIERMRVVLKEYSEAMLLYSKINDLPEPDTFRVMTLRKWLRRERMVDGMGTNSWGDQFHLKRNHLTILSHFWRLIRTIFWERESDKLDLGLVVTNKAKQPDGLTRWAYNEVLLFWEHVGAAWNSRAAHISHSHARTPKSSRFTYLRWFLNLRRKSSDSPLPTFSTDEEEERLSLAPDLIARLLPFARVLVAFVGVSGGLLPIIAIVVLSRVHKGQVLGYIALFTSLFTLGLMLLTLVGKTKISKLDVFTASAAFSAVMVVFVGNHS